MQKRFNAIAIAAGLTALLSIAAICFAQTQTQQQQQQQPQIPAQTQTQAQTQSQDQPQTQQQTQQRQQRQSQGPQSRRTQRVVPMKEVQVVQPGRQGQVHCAFQCRNG